VAALRGNRGRQEEKYPLLTQKAADFILFRQVVKHIKNKAQLSIEGLQ
jgi:hypothetical protein